MIHSRKLMFPIQSTLIHSTVNMNVFLNEWHDDQGSKPVKTIEINLNPDKPRQLLINDVKALIAVLSAFVDSTCTNYDCYYSSDEMLLVFDFIPQIKEEKHSRDVTAPHNMGPLLDDIRTRPTEPPNPPIEGGCDISLGGGNRVYCDYSLGHLGKHSWEEKA